MNLRQSLSFLRLLFLLIFSLLKHVLYIQLVVLEAEHLCLVLNSLAFLCLEFLHSLDFDLNNLGIIDGLLFG